MKFNFSLSKLLTVDTEVIEKIENCIKVTLGPTGKNGLVVTKNQGLKFLTNGSNIIKSLEFSNAESNTLLKLLEQIAVKTHSVAGDGSTITLLLACQLLKSSFRFLLSGSAPVEKYQISRFLLNSFYFESSSSAGLSVNLCCV